MICEYIHGLQTRYQSQSTAMCRARSVVLAESAFHVELGLHGNEADHASAGSYHTKLDMLLGPHTLPH